MLQLLPSGFSLPPVQYLLVVAGGVALALLALGLARPSVREVTVLALTPWMVVGAGLYALYQVDVFPDVVAPFFGSPIVYLTVFALLGFVWGLSSLLGGRELASMVLVVSGAGLVLAVLGLALVVGITRTTLDIAWPGAALVGAVVLTALTWGALGRLAPDATRITGWAGVLVVFAHVLDGLSTAVGVDQLGFGEQTPLSAAIITLGEGLPTEPFLGTAWLFVLLKLALAAAIVVFVADYVEEVPSEGYLLLAAVAAVGLGPGVHNIVLFSISPAQPTTAAVAPLAASLTAACPISLP
ncbi:DUF63 family protein [Halomarina oriensis]|uniref:DUF63 family protein n=1 Tax=Halomarina oriensis TaxID=671145 RepID=A0A6B0GNL1_9EURY|nr:DUF63 family protein [Halomarina oriensis]MWG35099.1 DUF63 family protein [Halomarina oriensis]